LKKKIKEKRGDSNENLGQKKSKDPFDVLYQTPEHLKTVRRTNNEVSGTISGIVEVSLPDSYRLKNIEATERARQEILDKKDLIKLGVSGTSEVVTPTNFNANFNMHSRYATEAGGSSDPTIEKHLEELREEQHSKKSSDRALPVPRPPVHAQPITRDRPTDDAVYEKFKKKFKY